MKIKTIKGVTYYAKTTKIGPAEDYYPIIEFIGSKIGLMSYRIITPQPTRSKALTIAKKYIHNIS